MKRREFLTLMAGAAASVPLAARAQQVAMPVVGFLHGASPSYLGQYLDVIRKGLYETGYVEGQNLAIEYRWAEGHYDRLASLAADLVNHKVAVILAMVAPTRRARQKRRHRPSRSYSSALPILLKLAWSQASIGLAAM